MERGGFRLDERERGRFEAGLPGRRSSGFDSDNQQQQPSHAPVVPHLAEKYAPEHPDADWGGFVQRSYKKRFYDDRTSAKDNLTYDANGGLMPDPSAASSNTVGRKLFEPHQTPAGDPSMPGVPFQTAVYQSHANYRSYASQTSMEATPKDGYALGTRQNSQHRRHVTPLYEKPFPDQRSSMRSASPPYAEAAALVSSASNGSLSGRRVDSKRSLLAGIGGKLVAAEDFGEKLAHGVKLGYTGRRRF
ncbi:hypothetical protein PybrP1_006116 [[Pythium] brassicae (nom. inval.)]|nr:hypothetical protein PybrP1_006116 [[Pythium] brassicae (nom. inval.)]